MSDQSKLGLGKVITEPQERDAIHVAVAPVVLAHEMAPGTHVGLDVTGRATSRTDKLVGVIDPFLKTRTPPGRTVWLFLYPGTITSLRHEWTHPALPVVTAPRADKSDSEKWMRAWAMEHMGEDYYGAADGKREEDAAYSDAIRAGHDMSVGPYEDARDHIDDEWWTHWEAITGAKGERGEYFSCGC